MVIGLQDFLLKSKSHTIATSDSRAADEKYQNGEQSSSRARGWLNWLSLGMLGAGGTADTSSFAGVVSDEIIKVISNLLLSCGCLFSALIYLVLCRIFMRQLSFIQWLLLMGIFQLKINFVHLPSNSTLAKLSLQSA